MAGRKSWLKMLKNEFSKSPLVSNAVFGFILMVLEKLVELEFECPCNPRQNGLFSSAFFIIPAVMAFILMLIFQGLERVDCWRKMVSSFVPAIVWLILLFMDGQIFVCAMTDWEGRFVIIDKADPQKWCQPVIQGNVSGQDLMLRSQELFVFSQILGIIFLLFICVGLVGYAIINCRLEVKTDAAELPMHTTRTRASCKGFHCQTCSDGMETQQEL